MNLPYSCIVHIYEYSADHRDMFHIVMKEMKLYFKQQNKCVCAMLDAECHRCFVKRIKPYFFWL
uniref:Uncharacterized protein n=1 Tax=viral metagenome TaxID=1070528 RepID=A0A6C0CPM4_9ZZZZ